MMELDYSIVQLLYMSANIMKRARKMPKHLQELSVSQRHLLRFILFGPKQITQKDLQQHFNLRRSSTSCLLKSLEAKHFIKRVPLASEKRIKVIKLTNKAKLLKKQIEEYGQFFENVVLKGFSEAEVKTLQSSLTKLINNLKEVEVNESFAAKVSA